MRSNFVGSDTMPIRHRPDFKQALSTLRRLKNAEDQAYYQNWWIERGNLRKSVNRLFTCGMSLTMNLVQNYSDQFGNSPRSLLSPTGGV